MSRSILSSFILLAGVTFASIALAAGEPTLHQVYEAANAGRLSEAQGMMDKVLRDHPGSAKAHFVEAEILAKQGRFANADTELDTAERLAPGLPFAKPDAVEKLKRHLSPSTAHTQLAPATYATQAQSAGGIPWGMLLLGIGLIAAIVFFVRSMSRRNIIPAGTGTAYATGYGSGAPLQPYGTGGIAPVMGPVAGGIGSGILGGLATGAALGAGMVAGEALMHHFTDGNRPDLGQTPLPSTADNWNPAPDDMGGNDFGISDGSSWDDSSSGGDWN